MPERTVMPSRHPELARIQSHVGIWTVTASAVGRAQAIRTGGTNDDKLGEEARTGFYSPNLGLDWTTTPDPPKYVKDAALRIVRARRKELGLPI